MSHVSSRPYEGQRLGTLVPGLVPTMADVPQLVGLMAPRRVVVAGGMDAQGGGLPVAAINGMFRVTGKHVSVIEPAETGLARELLR